MYFASSTKRLPNPSDTIGALMKPNDIFYLQSGINGL